MQIKSVVIGVVACLVAHSASAAERGSRAETTGVGAGVVIGALAGGPVGAILGAAVGARVGDEFHQRNQQVDSLNGSLAGSRTRVRDLEKNVTSLNVDIDSMSAELERMRSSHRPELLSLMSAGIEMDLLFRTDEHVLADTTGARLRELASSLASMSDIYVKLDGFADERGDAAYNEKLSQRRAEHVRDVLVANGVPPERVRIAAHGESPAVDASADSLALERRVGLTLYIDQSPAFASNPAP